MRKYDSETSIQRASSGVEKVSSIKRLSIFPLIFSKTDPLEAHMSLFSLILVAGTF